MFKIGRTVLKDAFNISEIREIASSEPVSNQRLALFNEDQLTFEPHHSEICLDTTPPTAVAMRDCAWNRAVIKVLANQAEYLISNTKDLSDHLSGRVDWVELFKSRFYDIFLDIQTARDANLPDLQAQTTAKYEEKKDRNKRRRELRQKFITRQQISSTMRAHFEKAGDDKELGFWTATLTVINNLQADGMSDEETGYEGEEQIKVVKKLPFRHPDLASLLQHVDSTPKMMKKLFDQGGRKRVRRVFSNETSQRSPPPNLPSTFYRQEYLALMRKGLVPWVSIQESPAIPIPEVNISNHSEVIPPTNQFELPSQQEPVTELKPTSRQEFDPLIITCNDLDSLTELQSDRQSLRHSSVVASTRSDRFLTLVIEWVVVASLFYILLTFYMDKL
ncbi:hypothetical protein VKT23_009457 [Stygiomarasmius scandens]|uniref:Uncharacterized protein n=1 Tax=Marasmiellus scandens TaxID=2682957 RepID=A0ABR1JHX7_9AGAR